MAYENPADRRDELIPVHINSKNKALVKLRAKQYGYQASTFAHDLITSAIECEKKCAQVIEILGL